MSLPASDAPSDRADPSVQSFAQLSPYADVCETASGEECRWHPVSGCPDSAGSLRFRHEVVRILQSVHKKIPPAELELRANVPHFIAHWAAHATTAQNQFALLMPVKPVARVPADLLMETIDLQNTIKPPDNNIAGYVRKRDERKGSYKRRYVGLNGSVLTEQRRRLRRATHY